MPTESILVGTGKNASSRVCCVQIKYIKVEAERFVREHGAEAYGKAQEAIRTAGRSKDPRKGRFLERVAREIARQAKEETEAGPSIEIEQCREVHIGKPRDQQEPVKTEVEEGNEETEKECREYAEHESKADLRNRRQAKSRAYPRLIKK